MLIYLYDRSFAGLLTAVYYGINQEIPPDRIVPELEYVPDLFSKAQLIPTDDNSSKKLAKLVRERISSQALRHAYYAFLTEQDGVEQEIFCYLKQGFLLGSKVDYYHGNDNVARIHKLSQRTSFERHRMLGLLRFRQLASKILYAPCEPDSDIAALLAPHFSRRLSDEHWVIHDTKREIAAIYDTKEWVMTPLSFDDLPYWDGDEISYQKLWKAFYQGVAISERKNIKLQKRCMPSRYWRYLIEKDD